MIHTEASQEELREEGRWAPRGGWTVFTGNPEELERRNVGKEFEAEETDEETTPTLPRGVPLPSARFLHLFSGHARAGDVEDALRRHGALEGILVRTDCADLGHGPEWNLLDEENVQRLCALAGAGYWQGVHSGPPCSTWSAARYSGRPGPPPLRSRDEP